MSIAVYLLSTLQYICYWHRSISAGLTINESSRAATKDTRSVDEGHEVYEGQLCCTKSIRAATKELQGCYEYNENSVSSWRLAAFRTTKLSSLPYTPRVFFVAACRPSLFQKESSPKTRGFTFVTLDLSYIFFVSPPVVNHLVDDAPIGKSAYSTIVNV